MSLRETALRGGAHLVGREVFGLLLRFGGALLVTRLIGPASFGIYAGALAIVSVLSWAAQLGAEVFLIRREDEPPRRLYDQVFTVLLVSTGIAVVVGLAGSVVAGRLVESQTAVEAFRVLVLALPLGVLWAPAQAMLERGFEFRSLAYLQVGSDAALYTVAVALALAGIGVWAPIAGTFASYSFLLVGSYALAHHRPRLAPSRACARELGRFGVQFTPAGLLGVSTHLINPLVVGSVLGAASVGYVALATRLADTAGFVTRATYRVSLVALSKVQTDAARLRRGFEEMLVLQAVGVGVPLALLCVTAPALLPVAFGEDWRPALDVLPFVSFGYLVSGLFATHMAMLYVMGRTLSTSAVSLTRFLLLGSSALVLVPPFGLTGYGVAVLVSTLAWIVLDRLVRRRLGFRYGAAARWVAVLVPALFVPLLPMPWGLALVAPALALMLLDHESQRQVLGYARFVRNRLSSEDEDDEAAAHDEALDPATGAADAGGAESPGPAVDADPAGTTVGEIDR